MKEFVCDILTHADPFVLARMMEATIEALEARGFFLFYDPQFACTSPSGSGASVLLVSRARGNSSAQAFPHLSACYWDPAREYHRKYGRTYCRACSGTGQAMDEQMEPVGGLCPECARKRVCPKCASALVTRGNACGTWCPSCEIDIQGHWASAPPEPKPCTCAEDLEKARGQR